jgi:hypothetical protein
MTPETENALVRKVDAIYDAITGPLGIKENGLAYQVDDHAKRITALERWRWLIIGGGIVVGFLVKVWAGAH